MTVAASERARKAAELEKKSAPEILEWAMGSFAPDIALSSSFQCEESVLMDLLFKLRGSDFRVFTLDTGRLNEETYEVMERLRGKYGIRIESRFPDRDAVEDLEREKGLYSFRESVENRKECCHIRKIVPLGRALSGLKGWITGLRREQSVTREGLAKVQWDEPHPGIVKVNPLMDWSTDQVWKYIKENKVPYNRLYDQGYTSIGCAPCTRAVKPGEGIRAGRWWWEDPEHKECGIHLPQK